MTPQEYLDALRRETDSAQCSACGSVGICAHREAEARLAGVEGLGRILPSRERQRSRGEPRSHRARDLFWNGEKWRRKTA